MNKFELSICVVTMNRANQLKEALESCVKCNLPEKTEFVIIDNASTDNTKDVVSDFFSQHSYPHYYEKLAKNKGVGGGRNYAYNKASGKYVYMLDDDAYIDENNKDFFIKAVERFEENDKIITLTTQIYDNKWKQNRVSVSGVPMYENVYKVYMLCGGSHFQKKAFLKKILILETNMDMKKLFRPCKLLMQTV